MTMALEGGEFGTKGWGGWGIIRAKHRGGSKGCFVFKSWLVEPLIIILYLVVSSFRNPLTVKCHLQYFV